MAQRSIDLLAIEAEIDRVRSLDLDKLRELWRATVGTLPPQALNKDLLARVIVHRMQEQAFGELDRATMKLLDELGRGNRPDVVPARRLKTGTVLVREYQGQRHTVTIVRDGYVWRETTYNSLSTIARAITGTTWNGPRFFGLRVADNEREVVTQPRSPAALSTFNHIRGSRRSNKDSRIGQQEGSS